MPPPRDTAVAALPPEYQPERTAAKELPPRFHRTLVDYPTVESPRTIIIDTPNTYLYLTIGHGRATSVSAARVSPGRAPSESAA
jgi:lipoprotein-anchoring transpeptidase ErfK/SrfK